MPRQIAIFALFLFGCTSVTESPTDLPADGPLDAAPVATPDSEPIYVACQGGDTISYSITTLYAPISEERDKTVGFNLDGVISTESNGTGCGFADKPNFDGEKGVDNQLEEILAELNVGFDIETELNAALADGTVAAELRIRGLDSYMNDDCVDLEIHYSGDVPAEEIALVQASITDGVVESGLGAVDGPLGLEFDPVKLRFTITPSAIVAGVLGGASPVEQVVAVVTAFAPNYGALAQIILEGNADMPSGATPCASVSAAFSFDASKL